MTLAITQLSGFGARKRGIAFVGAGEAAVSDNTALTVNLPSGTTTGDLVLFATSDSRAANVGFTTSGYTLLFNLDDVKIGWKIMGSTPDTTAVRGANGADGQAQVGIVFVFRFVNQSTPIDVTSTNNAGNSTTPDSPSITPVTAYAVVVSVVFSVVADAAVTGPSGYNNQTDIAGDGSLSDQTAGAAWKEIPVPAAENPGSWSNFTSGNWGAYSIALRPA